MITTHINSTGANTNVNSPSVGATGSAILAHHPHHHHHHHHQLNDSQPHHHIHDNFLQHLQEKQIHELILYNNIIQQNQLNQFAHHLKLTSSPTATTTTTTNQLTNTSSSSSSSSTSSLTNNDTTTTTNNHNKANNTTNSNDDNNNNNQSSPFPRYSSIDNISKKLNTIARIDSVTESDHDSNSNTETNSNNNNNNNTNNNNNSTNSNSSNRTNTPPSKSITTSTKNSLLECLYQRSQISSSLSSLQTSNQMSSSSSSTSSSSTAAAAAASSSSSSSNILNNKNSLSNSRLITVPNSQINNDNSSNIIIKTNSSSNINSNINNHNHNHNNHNNTSSSNNISNSTNNSINNNNNNENNNYLSSPNILNKSSFNEISASTSTITGGGSGSGSGNNSSNNLLNSPSASVSAIFTPPVSSNGISQEIKAKLRQKLLSQKSFSKTDKDQPNNNLNPHEINNNYLNVHPALDESNLTNLKQFRSEPNLNPVNKLLKDVIQGRNNKSRISNKYNPIFVPPNKRPPHGSSTNSDNEYPTSYPLMQSKSANLSHSSPSKYEKSSNQYQNDEIPTPLLARAPALQLIDSDKDNPAATAAIAASVAALLQQSYPFNATQTQPPFPRIGISAPILSVGPPQQSAQSFYNPLHWQALIGAIENAQAAQALTHPANSLSALKDVHNPTSLSLSALPNPSLLAHPHPQHPQASSVNVERPNRATFIPQFGHIGHVEEESELLLSNELRNEANKMDESMIYDQRDEEMDSPPHGYHPSHHHLSPHNPHFFKKFCYSDPYIIKPHTSYENNQNNSTTTQNTTTPTTSSTSMLTGTNSKNLRRTEINTDVEMDYASSDKATYKYTTGLVYDIRMLKHQCICNNTNNHIETPTRLQAIWQRLESRGIICECEVINSKKASIEDLALCHSEQYSYIYGTDIEQRALLRRDYLEQYLTNICLAPCNGWALLCDQDNFWNEESTPLACRVAVGCTYELSELVVTGKLKNGFALVRPPGSHAEHSKPLGFCYFNNVAITAKLLKKNLKLDRILIVDWDVHHGNGTQQLTYNDPNILYISLHRHDKGKFFPGSGAIDECGEGEGLGYNVNIGWDGKLEPPMGDAEYLAAFRCVVMPIAKAFKPQLVLVSSGFDGTEGHSKELGGYKLTPTCFAYMTKKLMSLADGKVVLVLEGGYHLPSLCDCSEMCLNALMNKQIPSFPNETLDAIPNDPAIRTLEGVIEIQRKHWPTVNSKYIKMSQNQFIRIDTE